MPQPDDLRHNLRLPKTLKVKLAHARADAGRSMNAEIVARLEQSFAPDPASQLVDILRPIASVSDDDRRELGELLVKVGSILAKGQAPAD
jgi:hypothetical protein